MPNRTVHFTDLGLKEYKETWDYQEKLFNATQEIKQNTALTSPLLPTPNHLIFCEHPHVFTLGKSGSENNLLINLIQLKAKNATFFKTNRGGDITYHGPGQIVGYPILDLENFSLGIKSYIDHLEEVIMLTLKEFGITSNRLAGATGVWIDSNTPSARKICAIGVRASRYITMHGFALNINTDLSYFSHINPCGFTDKTVTSMQKELGRDISLDEVKKSLMNNFEKVFTMKLIN